MHSIIKGKRIILRRPKLRDAYEIYNVCKHRYLSKWIPQIPFPYKIKDAIWFILKSVINLKKKKEYVFVIEKNKILIGMITLHAKHDNIFELGYWLNKKYWGQGLTTEAAKLMIKEAFKKLKAHKVYAKFLEGNKASEKVMLKLGMKKEGTLREHVKIGNKYLDTTYYSILKREYR